MRVCTASDFLDKVTASLGRHPGKCSTDLDRGPVAVPFEQPLVLISLDELSDQLPRLVERREVVEVQTLFLQRPDPAFHQFLQRDERQSANCHRSASFPAESRCTTSFICLGLLSQKNIERAEGEIRAIP